MDQLSADTPAAAYLAQHQVSQLLELGLEAMLKAYNPESGGLPSGRESRAPSSCSTHSPHHLLRTRRPSSRGPSQPHSHHDWRAAESACDFLARYLMRNNPRHNAEADLLLDKFTNHCARRPTLAEMDSIDKFEGVEAAAIVRMQAVERGAQVRRQIQKEKEERDVAIVRLQASCRGMQTRKEQAVAERREERLAREAASAAKPQAMHRGGVARRERQEQTNAATRVQAIHRGRMARASPR